MEDSIRVSWYDYPPKHRPPATVEPEIRPCIAELLRTGYHPSELVLRVERIIEVLFTPDTSTTTTTTTALAKPNRRSYRIFLSDGELVIQALLGKALHRFALTGEVTVGAVVRLDRFEIRRGERIAGGSGSGDGAEGSGQVVFLAVGGFRCLSKMGAEERRGRGDDVEVRMIARKRKRGDDDDDDSRRGEEALRISDVDGDANINGGEGDSCAEEQISEFLSGNLDDGFDSGNRSFGDYADSGSTQDAATDDQGLPGISPECPTPMPEQEKSIFKQRPPPQPQPQPQPPPPTTTKQDSPHNTQNERARTCTPIPTETETATHQPFKLPGILRPISRPLNLVTLSQLLHPAKPLPKRNYLCDVLAVISWISPDIVKRPQMPPKRDLRIMDPTIANHQQRLGVSVSVFVDAGTFNPPVGTVGLFRSLKTHEWEGVSLNAYEKDCKGREWFVCDPGRLTGMMGSGFDAEGMEEWWRVRCRGE
ncbi:hypothetical protein EMCG_04281 [[Emmonsia] crescens]|uniref:Uncharacterized protein n=1 Tax=[Emmonsia] crescens TaxID=73230 RepID=A0A0G2HTM9_9EURO|nr:hypothetical protein EMCG_04281 [Emmonsia crescens UAMH 3008]